MKEKLIDSMRSPLDATHFTPCHLKHCPLTDECVSFMVDGGWSAISSTDGSFTRSKPFIDVERSRLLSPESNKQRAALVHKSHNLATIHWQETTRSHCGHQSRDTY